MEIVLRAYDHEQVLRAESLEVRRLWTLLESGGIRDRAKQRAALDAEEDAWARETIASRLEALEQEGYGERTLAALRGAVPPDLASLRRKHWPPIAHEEAVALREDLVRYLTYGLWQEPEDQVAHALSLLSGKGDAAFLLRDPEAAPEMQEIFALIDDDRRFAERYGPAVRQAEPGRTDADVQGTLQRLQILLGPAARLIIGARSAGLRVIAYQDDPNGDGLTRFLDNEITRTDAEAQRSNGHRSNGASPEGGLSG